MKGIKSAKRILLCALIILSTLLCSLVSIKITHKNNKAKTDVPSGTYTFTSKAISIANYKNNTEFIINDVDGWISFTKSNDPEYLGYRGDYTDKKIILDGDIILEELDWSFRTPGGGGKSRLRIAYDFNGTIDGRGHSVIYTQNTSKVSVVLGEGCGHFVFNLKEKGKLKNIRFKNFQFVSGLGDKILFGGIAATNNGLIENCIVDGFYVVSDLWDEHCQVAPFAVNNEGIIKNCIVTGVYQCDVNGNGAGWDGYQPHWFVIDGNQPTNCVFDADVQLLNKDVGKSDCSGIEGSVPSGNYSSYTSAYSNIASPDAASNPGSLYEEENEDFSAWYKFNSGYGLYGKGDDYYTVYLRGFIDWSTIKFVAKQGGTVSQQKLIIPEGCEDSTISGETLTIYGTTITATPQDDTYVISSPCWVEEGANLYTANFTQKYIYIQFNNCTGTGVSVDGDSKVLADLVNGTVNVIATCNSASSGKWRLIIHYQYNGSTLWGATYHDMENKYYYVNYTISTVGNTVYITPNCALKSYGVQVQ